MHVVFVTSEFPTPGLPHGGVGTFVKFMSSSLAGKGVQASVIGFYSNVPGQGSVDLELGVTVYRLKSSRWKTLRFIDHAFRLNRRLRWLHHQSPVDIVESAELGLAFIWKVPGIKYVIRMHGGHHFFSESEKRGINAWRGFQERLSFAKADALVGVSQYVVDHTAKHLGFDSTKVPVIFNPVNLDRFYKADPLLMVPGRIVFIGTICEKKGIRQLVMAMPAICREVASAHLVIAGRDWLFPSGLSYTEYLKGFIDPAVKDRIHFVGVLPHSEVPALIESAEVCAFPSHMEAMPLAWLEALAMGKAVVASETGPGPEVIYSNVTGMLCDPYDSSDMANCIIKILENKVFRDELGQRAQEDIRHRFSIQEIINANCEFYRSIV